jgi:hypothetical protein
MHIIQIHTIGAWKRCTITVWKIKLVVFSKFPCLLQWNGERFQWYVWQESTTNVSFNGLSTLENWKNMPEKDDTWHGAPSAMVWPQYSMVNKMANSGTSCNDNSLKTRASHKKNHCFQNDKRQFGLELTMTSSFGVQTIYTVRKHHQLLDLIFFAHFRTRLIYLSTL